MSLKSKVMILVPNSIHGKGGIERLMLYLSREIAATSDELQIRVHATRWLERKPFNHLTTPLSLIAFWLRCLLFRPAVLHCNVAPRGSTFRKRLFVKAAQGLGIKVILHLHGSGYDAFFAAMPAKDQARVRAFFQSVEKVVVLGEYWRGFAEETLGIGLDRLEVINNGAPDTESRASAAGHPPQIAFAGLVGDRKGVDVLLEALSGLPADLDWSLKIGGNGEVDRFRARAEAAGLAERVTFLGWLGEREVDGLLSQSQIFVLPSRAENQPMSIIEAMAREMPVVSTAIGAIPEQVRNGETGFVVPPADPAVLSDALLRLIQSADLRGQMGKSARQHYLKHYSIAANARQFTALYKACAGH